MRHTTTRQSDISSFFGSAFPSVEQCAQVPSDSKELLIEFDSRIRSALIAIKADARKSAMPENEREKVERALVTVLASVLTDAGFATLNHDGNDDELLDEFTIVVEDCYRWSKRKHLSAAKPK